MTSGTTKQLRVGMAGMGMIFDDTYRPVLERLHTSPLYRPETGPVEVQLAAVATRTGRRAEKYRRQAAGKIAAFESLVGEDSAVRLSEQEVDAVLIATPDNRHFAPARAALAAGKHVLIEKPSVLSLQELDELTTLARQNGVLARVVYHKLFDPDHKKLRTLVLDGVLRHVNHGYASLLEPKQISGDQFAEWIRGRNPATYVAVHYLKLIDFTFGPDWSLKRIMTDGQRGIVGDAGGDTWDSVQTRVVYEHPDGREAAFDIHTSWVTPNNFPGYVEQEVQFRFDNGVWNAHQRKRGVELTVEDRTPHELKISLNNHYNGTFVEPWGEPSQRGYGLEAIERFLEEVALVEFGGPAQERDKRLEAIRGLAYADLTADRNVVATVQAIEAILQHAARGNPGAVAVVNSAEAGLLLRLPQTSESVVLYNGRV